VFFLLRIISNKSYKKESAIGKHNMQDSSSPDSSWISFADNANRFLQETQEHVLQGINPGGIYQAIWRRDAAYILKDWFFISQY
jgi:hypothetical protein